MASEDSGGGGNLWDNVRDGLDGIREGANDAADAIDNAVSFGSDPLGFLFEKTRDAAHGLSEQLLPVLFDATKPDLTAEWFLEAYAVSYAAAVFLWVVNLLWTIMQSARGVYTSDDVLEVLTTRAGLFFGMSTFGPAAGWLVLQFFGAATESIAQWGVNSSIDESMESLATMVEETDAAGVVGGVLVALVLMVLLLFGLVLVAIALFLTMITVYLGGAAAPLAFAWLAHPTHQRIATKLVAILLGAIAAKPLLFLILGFAYRMASGQVTWLEGASTDVQTMANLAAAMVALCVAGLTPFVLYRFAPVTPTGAGQAGPSLMRGARDGGSQDKQGSQTQQRARENHRRQEERAGKGESSAEGSGSGGNGSSAGGGGAGGGHDTGPVQQALEAKQREKAGGGKAAEEAAGGGKAPKAPASEGSPVKAGAGGGGGAPSGSAAAQAATKSGAAKGAAPAGSGAGAAGAGGGARVGGAGAAGAVGGGVAAAYELAKKGAQKGAQAGDVSAREMNDQEGGDGS